MYHSSSLTLVRVNTEGWTVFLNGTSSNRTLTTFKVWILRPRSSSFSLLLFPFPSTFGLTHLLSIFPGWSGTSRTIDRSSDKGQGSTVSGFLPKGTWRLRPDSRPSETFRRGRRSKGIDIPWRGQGCFPPQDVSGLNRYRVVETWDTVETRYYWAPYLTQDGVWDAGWGSERRIGTLNGTVRTRTPTPPLSDTSTHVRPFPGGGVWPGVEKEGNGLGDPETSCPTVNSSGLSTVERACRPRANRKEEKKKEKKERGQQQRSDLRTDLKFRSETAFLYTIVVRGESRRESLTVDRWKTPASSLVDV